MGKPHVHAALIHAWADGAHIQRLYHYPNNPTWKDAHCPAWDIRETYRIKPREFKKDAWYPAVDKYNQCVLIRFLRCDQGDEGKNLFKCRHEFWAEGHYLWIGEPLDIQWPEESE